MSTIKTLQIFIFIAFALLGCNKTEKVILPLSEVPGGGVRFDDPGKHESLKKELERSGVKYWEQEDGTISYLLVDTAKFREAKRKVAFGEELKSNVYESIPLLSEFEQKMFKEELNVAGIRFDEIADKGGRTNLYWSQVDSPKVDVIIQKVKIEAYNQSVGRNSGQFH